MATPAATIVSWYGDAVEWFIDGVSRGGPWSLAVLTAVLLVEHSPLGLLSPGPTCLVILGVVAATHADLWAWATPALAFVVIVLADYAFLFRAGRLKFVDRIVRIGFRGVRLFRPVETKTTAEFGGSRQRIVLAFTYQLTGWTRHHIPIVAGVRGMRRRVWVTQYSVPGTFSQLLVMFFGGAGATALGLPEAATVAGLTGVGWVVTGLLVLMYGSRTLRRP